MKNIAKHLMIVLFISLSSASFAQIFGVKAGFNLSNMLMKDNNTVYSENCKIKPGFHVGAIAEIKRDTLKIWGEGISLAEKTSHGNFPIRVFFTRKAIRTF